MVNLLVTFTKTLTKFFGIRQRGRQCRLRLLITQGCQSVADGRKLELLRLVWMWRC